MTPETRTLDLETLQLKHGAHSAASGEMCVMEAVAYVAGEPWTDSPQCASPVVAAFLRSYNDSVSDDVRQSLKPYIPRLIGTRASNAVEERRALAAVDWLVRVNTPAWLRLAGLTEQAAALESLPEITSMSQVPSIQPTLDAARRSADAAMAAAIAAAAWAAAARAAAIAAAAMAAAATDAAMAAAMAAAARAAAMAAAMDAASKKLKPTVEALQATVPALIEKMLAIKAE